MGGGSHIITKIIKSKFTVNPVYNICLICFFTGNGFEVGKTPIIGVFIFILMVVDERLFGYHGGSSQSKKVKYYTHPPGVTPCKVIVHGNQMYSTTRQSI